MPNTRSYQKRMEVFQKRVEAFARLLSKEFAYVGVPASVAITGGNPYYHVTVDAGSPTSMKFRIDIKTECIYSGTYLFGILRTIHQWKWGMKPMLKKDIVQALKNANNLKSPETTNVWKNMGQHASNVFGLSSLPPDKNMPKKGDVMWKKRLTKDNIPYEVDEVLSSNTLLLVELGMTADCLLVHRKNVEPVVVSRTRTGKWQGVEMPATGHVFVLAEFDTDAEELIPVG